MKMRTGMKLMNDIKDVPGDRICFFTDDDREMFEVRCGKDGRSIEVRGVETCKVNGVLYSEALIVQPNVSNSITILTKKYDDLPA